jgi:hypothetical protein
LNTKELTEPVVVKNLVKKFKKNGKSFSAVDNINFGIGKGKCFGYLKNRIKTLDFINRNIFKLSLVFWV